MLTVSLLLSKVIAYVFNFLNGMNDAANSISTIISTKVLTPMQAIIYAAFWEFVAFFLCKFIIGFAVAGTMGAGIANQDYMNSYVILSALVGAAIWVAVCTRTGMPISTSHALIGGIIGAVWFVYGSKALIAKGIIQTLSFIVLSPLIGFIFSFLLLCFFRWILKNSQRKKVERTFKRLQLFSTAAFCVGHGSNDAQKTMGIIAVLMYSVLNNPEVSSGVQNVISAFYDVGKGFYIPDGLALICYVVMSLGIAIGGKHVIKTLGGGLSKITPIKGFTSEISGATTLILTSILGIPVSTTHTITGGIIGVGIIDGVKNVKWVTAKRIILAWILTIPVPMVISGLIHVFLNFLIA